MWHFLDLVYYVYVYVRHDLFMSCGFDLFFIIIFIFIMIN